MCYFYMKQTLRVSYSKTRYMYNIKLRFCIRSKIFYPFRYPDCRFQSTKEEIQIRVELIKTFLPFLLPSSGNGAGPTLAASFILNQE